MMGLRGLELTSSTGPSVMCTPTARASAPVTRPAARASASLPAAPKAMAGGMYVPPGAIRIPGPVSRSVTTRSGTGARDWAAPSFARYASGEPLEMMIPPTWSRSTHPRRRCISRGSADGCAPETQGITSCATRWRSDIPARVRSTHSRSPGSRTRALVAGSTAGSAPGEAAWCPCWRGSGPPEHPARRAARTTGRRPGRAAPRPWDLDMVLPASGAVTVSA